MIAIDFQREKLLNTDLRVFTRERIMLVLNLLNTRRQGRTFHPENRDDTDRSLRQRGIGRCTIQEHLEFLAAPLACEIGWRVEGYSDPACLQSIGQLAPPDCSSLDAGFVEEADSKTRDGHLHGNLRTEIVNEPLHVFVIRLIFCVGPRVACEKDGGNRCSWHISNQSTQKLTR